MSNSRKRSISRGKSPLGTQSDHADSDSDTQSQYNEGDVAMESSENLDSYSASVINEDDDKVSPDFETI